MPVLKTHGMGMRMFSWTHVTAEKAWKEQLLFDFFIKTI